MGGSANVIHRRGERQQKGQFGTFIGRYRDGYADEKQLQSDGNMPSLPEQERTRFRRGPMNRDFSPIAASRTAAIVAVRHNGRRFEIGSDRYRQSRLQHVRGRNLHEQAAGHA